MIVRPKMPPEGCVFGKARDKDEKAAAFGSEKPSVAAFAYF